MKNLVDRIVPVVIVLAIGYWIASGIISSKQADADKQKQEQEKKEAELKEQKFIAEKHLKIEQSIKEMIAKYNASTDWLSIFDRKDGSLNRVYSFEIQEALTEIDNRPIMFLAFVSDIVRESEYFYVHFCCFNLDSDIRSDVFIIEFILICTQDQVNVIILNQRDSLECNYAVIAKISSAKKDTSEEYNFIATGNCLDLIFVGDFQLKNFLQVDISRI